MKLNEKQALAANTIDKNVLLDASAGTGKTTVLVNRYVNILDKGNFNGIKNEDILSSVVAITFTNICLNSFSYDYQHFRRLNNQSKKICFYFLIDS